MERLDKLAKIGHWARPRCTEGLQFQEEKYLQFLKDVCSPYKGEYLLFPRKAPSDGEGFFFKNNWFETIDAEVLYCVIRHFQPSHVVEVGSGFSTRLMRKAIQDGNIQTKLISIDPQPRVDIRPYADEIIPSVVQEVDPLKIADRVGSDGLLFIDSSHTIVTGGDVPFLYLDLLPKLKKGALIQIHDVFLPFDYRQEWVREGRGWTEQYLLQAFLWDNSFFEIIWPARYMWEYQRSELLATIPSESPENIPSSFWLRKVR